MAVVVRKIGDRWILVEQFEHARHSGELAEAWSSGPFGPLHPSLLTAASLHDIGWRTWDWQPQIDPGTGGPANFPTVGDTQHSGFYEKGIEEVAGVDPYAGYLVSLHASGIYGGRFGWSGLQQVAWPSIGERGRRFLGEQVAYRRRLLSRIGEADPGAVEFATTWEAYMMLQTLDYLSLQCCLGLDSDGCAPVPLGDRWGRLAVTRRSAWTVELDPFPFPGTRLEVPVAYRALPAQTFADDQQLRDALNSAAEATAVTVYEAPSR
jgi:Protein of unknown function (DUF3891)